MILIVKRILTFKSVFLFCPTDFYSLTSVHSLQFVLYELKLSQEVSQLLFELFSIQTYWKPLAKKK